MAAVRKPFYPQLLLVSLLIIATALTLSGCTVVAGYDQVIDQTVTALQSEVFTFLAKMERCAGTPEGEYKNNRDFYDKMNGELDSLSTRAAAVPRNEIIIDQLKLLKGNIENLRKIHGNQKEAGITKELMLPIKFAFEKTFTAIIKLENALKRGEDKRN